MTGPRQSGWLRITRFYLGIVILFSLALLPLGGRYWPAVLGCVGLLGAAILVPLLLIARTEDRIEVWIIRLGSARWREAYGQLYRRIRSPRVVRMLRHALEREMNPDAILRIRDLLNPESGSSPSTTATRISPR